MSTTTKERTIEDLTTYQVSDEFPPDKEKDWNYANEESGWMHAHNALRLEMEQLSKSAKAIQARCKESSSTPAPWEIECMERAWKAHEVHVHCHHTNEDKLLVPHLKTRFHYPEKSETDHDDLLAKLDVVNKVVAELVAATGDDVQKVGAVVDKLCDEVVDYQSKMLPHLEQEEKECLVLTRAFFTSKELEPKFQEIVSQGNKIEMGSFIYCMGSDHFCNSFMPQEGIPFFVWYIEFRWQLKVFLKEFVDPTSAIISGTKPVPPSFWSFAWLW